MKGVKRWVWIPVVLAMLSLLYHPVRMTAFVLAGLGNHCTVERAVKSGDELKNQIRFKDEILAASKLIETDPAGFKLYETPLGRYWIPTGSEFVLPYNLAEVKRAIYFDGNHTVRPGDVVLDGGANIGVFTRAALDLGAAKVIAVEPAPENIESLRRNFTKEIEEGRVILVPKGIWNEETELEFRVDPKNSAADSFVMNPEGSRVVGRIPVTTIDRLVDELGLSRLDFIKLDIEGAEPNAIDGARGTIERFKPRISISAYHAGDHPKILPEKILAARGDYEMVCGPCAETTFGVRPDILYFH